MPTNQQYNTGAAVIHGDGSVSLTNVIYEWNGSTFVKRSAVDTTIDAATANQRALQVADDITRDFWGRYAISPETKLMNPLDIAFMRLAINKGYTTLEKALAFSGTFTVVLARAWGFQADSLPATLSEAQEGLLLADYNNAVLRVSEVLTKPGSFVNDTAYSAPGAVWAVPVGSTLQQATAQAWTTSSVASIANAATQALTAPPTGQAAPSVPFALAASAHVDTIQKAYLAFFLRPADAVGFNFYAEKMAASGGDLTLMTSGFGLSPEYLQTYAGLNTFQRIDAIYQNLFNRSAEAAGLEYWGTRLENGTFTINDIAVSILLGAQNADASVVANRVSLARQFTNTFDTWDKVNAYAGVESAAQARALLKTVTDDPNTVFTAGQARADVMKTLGVLGTITRGATGDQITLTSTGKVDVLVLSPEANAGMVDVVRGFSGDKLDLSSFRLSSREVGQKQLASPQTGAAGAFFGNGQVALATVGADTWVYVDVDKNGSFDPGKDAVVHVVGATVQVSDLII